MVMMTHNAGCGGDDGHTMQGVVVMMAHNHHRVWCDDDTQCPALWW